MHFPSCAVNFQWKNWNSLLKKNIFTQVFLSCKFRETNIVKLIIIKCKQNNFKQGTKISFFFFKNPKPVQFNVQ